MKKGCQKSKIILRKLNLAESTFFLLNFQEKQFGMISATLKSNLGPVGIESSIYINSQIGFFKIADFYFSFSLVILRITHIRSLNFQFKLHSPKMISEPYNFLRHYLSIYDMHEKHSHGMSSLANSYLRKRPLYVKI